MERTLRILLLQRVHCLPRLHLLVKDSLQVSFKVLLNALRVSGSRFGISPASGFLGVILQSCEEIATREVWRESTPLQLEVQKTLLLLLQRGLSQLQKNKQTTLGDWSVGSFFVSPLREAPTQTEFFACEGSSDSLAQKQVPFCRGPSSLRRALDPVWSKLDLKTRALVNVRDARQAKAQMLLATGSCSFCTCSRLRTFVGEGFFLQDLMVFRRLVFLLWKLHSVAFLSVFESLLATKSFDEAWLHTTEMQVLIRRSRERQEAARQAGWSQGLSACEAAVLFVYRPCAFRVFSLTRTPPSAGPAAAESNSKKRRRCRQFETKEGAASLPHRVAFLNLEEPQVLNWASEWISNLSLTDDVLAALAEEQWRSPSLEGVAASLQKVSGGAEQKPQGEDVECICLDSAESDADGAAAGVGVADDFDDSCCSEGASSASSDEAKSAPAKTAPVAAASDCTRPLEYRVLFVTSHEGASCELRAALLAGVRTLLLRSLKAFLAGSGDASSGLNAGLSGASLTRETQRLLTAALEEENSQSRHATTAGAVALLDSGAALSDRSLNKSLRRRTRGLR